MFAFIPDHAGPGPVLTSKLILYSMVCAETHSIVLLNTWVNAIIIRTLPPVLPIKPYESHGHCLDLTSSL